MKFIGKFIISERRGTICSLRGRRKMERGGGGGRGDRLGWNLKRDKVWGNANSLFKGLFRSRSRSSLRKLPCILKWTGFIKSPDCVHLFGARHSQVAGRDNSRRVGTHENNSGDAVRLLGQTKQSMLNVCPIRSKHSLDCWEMVSCELESVLENFRHTFSDCPCMGLGHREPERCIS